MTGEFSAATILVTGAGSGIGRATAEACGLAGAAVVVVDIDEGAAEETAQAIRRSGGIAVAVAADVTDEASVERMFEAAIGYRGGITHAVNNAGVPQKHALTGDIDPAVWDRIFAVNVRGVFLCMQAELRHMAAKGGGVIVNTASVAGLRTLAGRSAYVASKHAVVGLTKNAAVEYATQGIRINAVCPGGVHTGMTEVTLLGLSAERREEVLRANSQFHPMKRLGTPEEIADAIVFLLSDQSRFITGQMLGVDGGWTAA